jgi:hypothetical protein
MPTPRITKKQRVALMAQLWPDACEAQGWDREDDARRYEVFAAALGQLPRYAAILRERGEIHTGDLDPHEGFTVLKNHLLMLAGNLKGAVKTEQINVQLREAVTYRIEEHLRCLALFPLPAPIGHDGAEALANKLAGDLAWAGRAKGVEFREWRELDAERRVRLRDGEPQESPSDLERLLMNLARIVNDRRGTAGLTIHEMNVRADLKCSCALCTKPRRRRGVIAADRRPEPVAPPAPEPEPAMAGAQDPDWSV